MEKKKRDKRRKRQEIAVNLKDSTRSNPKYRLNEEEVAIIHEYRRIYNECIDNGVDPKEVKAGWIKSENSSLYFRNANFQGQLEARLEFEENLKKEFKKYSPKYPKIKRGKTKDGHLLVIDIADLHINKYAESFLTGKEYNSNIAVERALEGTKGILQKSKGFTIDKILFIIGNDVLNIDNSTKSTTKLTPQDTDLHWFKAFNIAKECYVKCIEMCMTVADVDVIHCPSNHDLVSGCFLAETLQAWFRKSKNINFETSPKYRKYYQYHNNMIELEHGDKGNMSNIPLVMAQEEPTMWANTKFRYGYLHHIHHQDKTSWKSAKDYVGVNITYLRSPSSADIWHSENQYLNIVAVEGFIHSKEMGRVSQLTHYF